MHFYFHSHSGTVYFFILYEFFPIKFGFHWLSPLQSYLIFRFLELEDLFYFHIPVFYSHSKKVYFFLFYQNFPKNFYFHWLSTSISCLIFLFLELEDSFYFHIPVFYSHSHTGAVHFFIPYAFFPINFDLSPLESYLIFLFLELKDLFYVRNHVSSTYFDLIPVPTKHFLLLFSWSLSRTHSQSFVGKQACSLVGLFLLWDSDLAIFSGSFHPHH